MLSITKKTYYVIDFNKIQLIECSNVSHITQCTNDNGRHNFTQYIHLITFNSKFYMFIDLITYI